MEIRPVPRACSRSAASNFVRGCEDTGCCRSRDEPRDLPPSRVSSSACSLPITLSAPQVNLLQCARRSRFGRTRADRPRLSDVWQTEAVTCDGPSRLPSGVACGPGAAWTRRERVGLVQTEDLPAGPVSVSRQLPLALRHVVEGTCAYVQKGVSRIGAGPPRFPLTPNSRLDLPQAGGEPQTTAVAYSLFRRDFVCGHALAARGSRSRFEASPPVGGSRGAGRVRL